MGTLMPATPPQTLYVSVRRDELRKLKDERDQLRQQVAQLNLLLAQQRTDDKAVSL
ncbi:DUF6026 family protein [Pseudomonas putida]|jgi:hypothetical protein|uniref:Uncharacterized protein n=3 Tax=Pseudomonas TaxID=286 RepID=A0A7L9GEX2_9PSED|nr:MULTISPECIES: DUF6026 family protein [Pseudomonas]WPE26312.1 hypothetical protein PshuTeo1_20290 [Pseudomonas hunanensis]AFK71477.1 hypothetical protein YSA_08700 [Pseudomonas putida ND6]EKT4458015.1 hypothetical protein [Pseudomonas putida]EKT4472192.1 hypothetical protein [Pseudomonas putida]EKT4494247.1 hypothetical protein [Pseudomonas putida]